MGKLLLIAGLLLALVGLLVMWGLPIGRMPGDVVVRRGGFTFYFPVVTSIILSIVLTIVFRMFR
jgi:membrane protein implicated in regulation of membrane protease activity